jgi:hypothetical protein
MGAAAYVWSWPNERLHRRAAASLQAR